VPKKKDSKDLILERKPPLAVNVTVNYIPDKTYGSDKLVSLVRNMWVYS